MASRATELLLRAWSDRDRERALAFERTRRALTAPPLATVYGDALRRLHADPAVRVGRLRPGGEPIDLADAIALTHAIIVGATGSGKTRFLIGLLLAFLGRRPAVSGATLPFECEVLDPKGETAQLLKLYLAVLWLRGDAATRAAIADATYVIDWTRDWITPGAPYDNRAQIVSDAYLAHLLTDVTIQASRQTYSEPLRQLLFMWSWLLIDLTFPANFAFANRFLRDEPYRRETLAKVRSSEVRQFFAALDSVVARQTLDAFLRRLQADLSFPENRFAIGVPPERLRALRRPEDARIVIGNYGCSNVLPQSLGLLRATWRAIGVLLDAPRRRRTTPKTIIFEELALLLSASTELLEILMTALRTLRSVRVNLFLASQDLASSLPKNAVRNIVLNTRWSATFQSRADEAELLYPLVVADPADRRPAGERHRAFLRDIQTLPRQEYWLTVKGGYPALPARSIDVPDPSALAGGVPEDELADLFQKEIACHSMLPTSEAAHAIESWEAEVVGRAEVRSSTHTRAQRAPGSLRDLLAHLGRTTDEEGPNDDEDAE